MLGLPFRLLIAILCYSVVGLGQAHEFEIFSFLDRNEKNFYLPSRDVESGYIHRPANRWKENIGIGYNYFMKLRKEGFNFKVRAGYSKRNFQSGIYSDAGIFYSSPTYKAEYIDVYAGLGYEFVKEKISLEPAFFLGSGLPLWKENEMFTTSADGSSPFSMGGLLVMVDVNVNLEFKIVENLKYTWSIGLQPRLNTYFTSMYNMDNYTNSKSTIPHFGWGIGINTSYFFR